MKSKSFFQQLDELTEVIFSVVENLINDNEKEIQKWTKNKQ